MTVGAGDEDRTVCISKGHLDDHDQVFPPVKSADRGNESLWECMVSSFLGRPSVPAVGPG